MRRSLLYSLALLILAADQLTKRWVLHTFQHDESREIIPGIFSLTFVHNTGGAFGILPNSTLGLATASGIAVAAILYFTWRARKPISPLLIVALALPLGGAIGNLCDRVRLRYVVDFLDVHYGSWRWPVFNIADSAICIGIVLLTYYFWRLPALTQTPAVVNEEL